MSLAWPDETVYFKKSEPIQIYSRNAKTYFRVHKYDIEFHNLNNVWHQISVEHQGSACGEKGAREILDCIFDAVEGEEFYPVGYRVGPKENRFLVRQCQIALDKLFARGLRVQLSNGIFVNLKVQFNVAKFIPGHLVPLERIRQEIKLCFSKLVVVENVSQVLNLSRFEERFHANDLVVCMGNRSVLRNICKEVYADGERFRTLSGIKLSDNGILGLSPLVIFKGFQLLLLDLRNNELSSIPRLCNDIKDLRVDNLFLSGNPLTKSASYPDGLHPLFKAIKTIDGILVNRLSKDYTPTNDMVNVEFTGYRIDSDNQGDLLKYEKSDFWHALVIPDGVNELTRDEIAEVIFDNILPTKFKIYLCYYTFKKGEHQFFVRNCFNVLQYIVKEKKFEFSHVKPAAADGDTKSTISFYLRMNISPFQPGHINPRSAFLKLLKMRYETSTMTLNLHNLKRAKRLPHIILNMTSPYVINGLLFLAAKEYTTIRSLIMSSNTISTCDWIQSVAHMKYLRSVDLSHNLITSLDDIKSLQDLGLQSLNLNGNPICSKYSSEQQYIKDVTAVFPDLSVLDTVNIVQMKKRCWTRRKNYLVDVDCYSVVDEFVPQYFRVFATNRPRIIDLYNRNVVLTISYDYSVDCLKTQNARERYDHYKALSRNILANNTGKPDITNLHIGRKPVYKVLLSLPQMTFDVVNFTTDSTFMTDNFKVITVSGVFLDIGQTLKDPDMLVGFTRTFCLKRVQVHMGALKTSDAYQIVNEQFSMYMPSRKQMQTTFKYVKPKPENSAQMALTPTYKKTLMTILHSVTKLKFAWCHRILSTANWNIIDAMKLFKVKHNKEEIPNSAFKI